MSLSPESILFIFIMASVFIVLSLIATHITPPTFCSFQHKANADCNYYPQEYYYDGVLQLYRHNPSGNIWSLEGGPLPYNSGSEVVKVGNGWYTNQGASLNNIRNEVATPHFAQNRPYLGIGGNGPYDQDSWRYYGFMDQRNDWKDIEVTGIFFPCSYCEKAGQGPQSVDMVLRGGVNEDNPPDSCQATNYHIAYSFVGNDGGWKLERDIDHYNINGYCNGCRAADKLPVAPDIPITGLTHPFGLKAVIYNNVQNTAVRIDVYLDPTGTGHQWKLAWSYIDNGKDPLIDSVRGPIGCQGEHPELPITWGGPAVNFRINAAGVDFRQLTVQEIIAPKW